ncbi:MAG: hypothetical protein MI921_00030 [Cytophagales bacterium]|nr:hypothetical protein [Cytophagales bacterium]
MSYEDFEIYDLSIVIIGQFNPMIIHPLWLAQKGLIREGESHPEISKVEIMHRDIVKFELVDWSEFVITKERFEIKTSNSAYFEPVKDLVISIFGILGETPLYSMGINHTLHYSFQDINRSKSFANSFVPLAKWNETISDPRLLRLEILEQKRKDGRNGSVRVRIESSSKLINTMGVGSVAIDINDHYQASNSAGENIVEILQSVWKDSSERAKEIITGIWKNT